MMIIFLRVNKVEFYSNMLQRNYCNDFEQVYIWWEVDVIEIIGNYFNVLFIEYYLFGRYYVFSRYCKLFCY